MRKGEAVDPKHLESSISVALRMGKFRQAKGLPDPEQIYAWAARTVVESFQRNGWSVIHAHDYPGCGPEGTGRFMRQEEPYKRCEGCDD